MMRTQLWNERLADRRITPMLAPMMEHALDFLEPLRGGDLLDLGCANGAKTDTFREYGWRAVGVDINPEAMAAAAEIWPRCEFHFGRLEELPFADDSFDATFGCSVLQYVDIPATIEQVGRVLRPGGRAVFVVNLAHHPLIRALRVYRRAVRHRYAPFMTPRRHTEPAELERVFSPERGWASLSITPFAITTPLSLRGAPLAPLQHIDDRILSRLPGSRRWCWRALVLAEREQTS